jgi:hypothetical protein
MLSSFRDRVGTAGLIVAIVALVAALSGAAVAATGGSSDGKATASAKAKKGPRGPKGPKGDTGPAGPQGPAGANGKDGANGSNGSNGAEGAKGATGPTGKTGNNGTAGAEGATGLTGATGPTGSFGGEILPAGVTETGGWIASGSLTEVTLKDTNGKEEVSEETVKIGNPYAYGMISFQQNPGTITENHFRTDPNFTDFDEGGPGEEGCKGTNSSPAAPPGHLCVYGGVGVFAKNMTFVSMGAPPNFEQPSSFGLPIQFTVDGPEAYATGVWAFTGLGA